MFLFRIINFPAHVETIATASALKENKNAVDNAYVHPFSTEWKWFNLDKLTSLVLQLQVLA